MSHLKKPSRAELAKHLLYDAATGRFTWLIGGSGRKIGAEAGSLTTDGYVVICICGARYRAHHLAWLFVTGRWPDVQIDHRDRCKANNRFLNLREADAWQNAHNKVAPITNKSGHKGIRFKKNRWEVMCMIRGHRSYLGRFLTKADAVSAYATFSKSHTKEFFCQPKGVST